MVGVEIGAVLGWAGHRVWRWYRGGNDRRSRPVASAHLPVRLAENGAEILQSVGFLVNPVSSSWPVTVPLAAPDALKCPLIVYTPFGLDARKRPFWIAAVGNLVMTLLGLSTPHGA